MGYTTDFAGAISLKPQLSIQFVDQFNHTAEGRNNVYGDGSPDSFDGVLYDSVGSVVTPKSRVPSCWCSWRLRNEGNMNSRETFIEWSGDEKFYDYISWLQFVVDYILERHPGVEFEFGGKISWQGESLEDTGHMTLAMSSDCWSVIATSNILPKEKMMYFPLSHWFQYTSHMEQVGNLFNKPYAICLLQKDLSIWCLSKMTKTINLQMDYLIKTVYHSCVHSIPPPGPPSLLDLCISYVANQNLPTTAIPSDIKQKVVFGCRRCSGCGCKFFGRGYFVPFSTLDGGGYGTLPIGLFCSVGCYDKDAIIVGGPDITFYPNI